MIVVSISEEGNGERDGVNVVGISEGVLVGDTLGVVDGTIEGD